MLSKRTVGCCKADGCCELMMLFVEAQVHRGSMEEPMNVIEAHLSAEDIKGDGEKGPEN